MDRITLFKKVENNEEFKDIVINEGKCFSVGKNTLVYKYVIDACLFKLAFFPINNMVILDFNLARNKYGVNFGEVTLKDAKEFIDIVNNYFQHKLKMQTDIGSWKIGTIEIKEDIKYKNNIIAQAVIDTYKKCTKANMKTLNYQTTYFRFNKNIKFCIYRKDVELKDTGKWGTLTKEKQSEIKNVVRYEVKLNQLKLSSILNSKNVKFQDILNPYIQTAIHKSCFRALGFGQDLLTKNQLIAKINKLQYQKRKIDNLLRVVELLNEMSFKQVKKRVPSIYNYLKILKEHNICPYYIDEESLLMEGIEVRKQRKKHSKVLLKKFLKLTINNICILINHFNNVEYFIRI